MTSRHFTSGHTWVSRMSRSHFVYSAPMSLLWMTVSQLNCASPIHPRLSRCGQSVGISMRLDMCAARVACWMALSDATDVENAPTCGTAECTKCATSADGGGTPGYPDICT